MHLVLPLVYPGALLPLLEPFNLLPPALNHNAMSSNSEFDQTDKFGESSPAKQEDVFRIHFGEVNIGFLGSNEDMTAQKAQEPITAATFS